VVEGERKGRKAESEDKGREWFTSIYKKVIT